MEKDDIKKTVPLSDFTWYNLPFGIIVYFNRTGIGWDWTPERKEKKE